MTSWLTVTGTYRSGTTLVERLIDQHPYAALSTQPLPHLWLNAKREYLKTRGYSRGMPLGTLFRDPAHNPEALATFLETWPTDPVCLLQEVATTQQGFDGAMTPEADRLPERWTGKHDGGLRNVIEWAYQELAISTGRAEATLLGAKEIVIDEFVPTLLSWGHQVVLVLRDLRSVLASSLHGSAEEFVGSARPTLFTVRTWRRTVAMALAFRDHPQCHVVRYEDILDQPSAIRSVWQASGLSPAPDVELDADRLTDQYGVPWPANTSFGQSANRGNDSVTRALNTLDTVTLEYVAAAAGPELLACGYVDELIDDPEPALRAFREPVPMTRRTFDPYFSTSERELETELERLALLDQSSLDPMHARTWFIMPEAFQGLRTACQYGLSLLG